MIIKYKSLFILFFFIPVVFSSIDISAQTKVGYIDSKKIIDGMQDSRDAKARLDNQVTEWQTELKVLQDSLQSMKDDFEKKGFTINLKNISQISPKIYCISFLTAIGIICFESFHDIIPLYIKNEEFPPHLIL